MKFKDLLYVSLENFKNRKSRIFFTVLGVAVAIAVVLSLVSFGYGLQKNLLNQITTEESLLSLDITPSDPKIIQIDTAQIEKLSKMESVEKISAEAVFNGQASYNGVIGEVNINIIEPDFFILDGKLPMAGKFFDNKDYKKIVVSSVIADLFNFTHDSIIGKTMHFKIFVPDAKDPTKINEISFGDDYKIVGVIESSSAEVFVRPEDVPGVSISNYALAKVKVKDSKKIEDVRSKLINMGFVVSSLSDIVSQANKIFTVIQITLGIFGVFALVVAAIGLVNTMTISLLERTNEIGIMRAIGAAPGDIRKIFLGESIMIGFLGGVSGIILGILGSELLNWAFNILAATLGGEPVRLFAYPIWFIVFIIGLSTFVGLAGGIWPAQRAANMNPLEALRYK